jgi:UDP-MurNAc hydroxylase
MSSFKILSHASLLVQDECTSLLFDPWLIGSCYWRSWWNYPPVKKELYKNLKPNAIYITHFHWDHWHGPSLKKLFSRDTLIITHDEPNKRSYNDLLKIGFKNTMLLKHGESYKLDNIVITPYQFGLFLNDSAVVVETPDFKLLNANDCKIAGPSLRYVLKKHGQFDFALRSHSSANDRVCYKIKNDPEFSNDEQLHYARSFKLFMDAVSPRYAVPFASNHVHLHKDVFSSNSIVNDPYKLKNTIENLGGLNSDLKIMVSGDQWDSKNEFAVCDESHNYFVNKNASLAKYLKTKNEVLEKYYKIEDNTVISEKVINEFIYQMNCIHKFARRKYKNLTYCLHLFSDTKDLFYRVTPYKAEIKKISALDQKLSHIKIPIRIFRDSVYLNMFHHSSISKRNSYILNSTDELIMYSSFQSQLEKVELGVYPLKLKYFLRFFLSYARRWRELFVYIKAYLLLRQGVTIYDAEEKILSNT